MTMEDELSLSLDGKTLGNLRVVDLKQELEKRGLSKSGSKKDLVKRLKQQLEFEKLCEENKSSGDCELKKELDAATEQNEFVQRYLAQQQKIFAEQKEMKRLVELEEIQKKSELKECHVSPETSGNHSSDESEIEQDVEVGECDSTESAIKNESDSYEISLKESQEKDSFLRKEGNTKISLAVEKPNDDILKKDVIETETISLKAVSQADETISDKTLIRCTKNEVDLVCSVSEKDSVLNEKISTDSASTEAEKNDNVSDIDANQKIKSKLIANKESDLSLDNTKNEIINKFTTIESSLCVNETSDILSKKENQVVDDTLKKVLDCPKDEVTDDIKSSKDSKVSDLVQTRSLQKEEKTLADDKNRSNTYTSDLKEHFKSVVHEVTEASSKIEQTSAVSPSSSHHQYVKSEVENYPHEVHCSGDDSRISSSNKSLSDSLSLDKPFTMDATVPYSLSDIKLPDSPSNIIKTSGITNYKKDDSSPKKLQNDEEESRSDIEVHANGVDSISKSNEKQSKTKPILKSKSSSEESSTKDVESDFQALSAKENKEESQKDSFSETENNKNKYESRSPIHKKSLGEENFSDSEDKSSSKADNIKDSNSNNSKSEESSSEESSSGEENGKRRSRITSVKLSKIKKPRTPSSSRSPSSQSRDSSPEKVSSDENSHLKNKSAFSEVSQVPTDTSTSEKSSNKLTTVDGNNPVCNDTSRKKLKINRNNVVIPPKEITERSPEKTKSSKISAIKSGPRSPQRTIESAKISSPLPKKISPKKITEEKPKEPSSPLHLSSEVNEPEMGEIIENSPEMKYETRKLKFPGRKLDRKSSEDQSSTEPKAKKSKWGKFASSQKSSQAINISTDSLKNWFPEFKLVNETTNKTESITENSSPVVDDKKLSFTINTENETDKKSIAANVVLESDKEQSLEMTESIGPVSKIVFIQNLVRPFTLLQLKELLKQSGCLIEEEFWIDKIKSKCFATYETEEDAIKTRNALNGTRWPSSNPKILVAEFSTEEELELYRSGADVPKLAPESVPDVKESLDTKSSHLLSDHRKRERDSEKRKERDRYRQQLPVREWDKDKISQDSPDRENIGKEPNSLRAMEKKDKKESKKRLNEDTPAKLLDDLFQKTKSAPCIYWLPLTEVQVVEREEAKKLRKLEREKRIQQREQEEAEHKNKRPRTDHKSKETESRRSSSRSPANRRR